MIREVAFHREVLDKQTDIVRWVGLQVAMFDVDDTVEQAWQMVAETFAVFLGVGASRSAVGEPFAVREAVFQLVTIVKLFLAAKNRHHLGIFNLPDAVEVVFYLFLFVIQLPLIIKVLPLASATEAEVLAHRLHTLVGFLFNVENLAVEAVRFLLKHLNVNDVARCSEGDEHHFLVRLCNAHAFRAGVDNFDVFEILGLMMSFHGCKGTK